MEIFFINNFRAKNVDINVHNNKNVIIDINSHLYEYFYTQINPFINTE